jgi:Phage tail assembly chaperone proteins, E, or 41 or 14
MSNQLENPTANPGVLKNPNTVPLAHPYMLADGSMLTEVTWKRLKGKDMMAIAKLAGNDQANVELYGIARMLSMIPEDVLEMDAEDFYTFKGRFLDILGVTTRTEGSESVVSALV